MSVVGKIQAAQDNIDQGVAALTSAQADFENVIDNLISAAEDVAGGGGTGTELAQAMQGVVDEIEKLMQRAEKIKSDASDWARSLQA